MTNYGALAILALPKLGGGQGGEAEIRLALALETVRHDGSGVRRVTIEQLAGLAGLELRRARRARDRLTDKGVIEHRRGRAGGVGSWRFLVSLIPDSQVTAIADSQVSGKSGQPGVRYEPEPDSQVSAMSPSPGAPIPDTGGSHTGHLGRPHSLSTTSLNGPVGAEADRAGARPDADAQPDWQRGPAPREPDRIWPPGTAPGRRRGTGPDDRPIGERSADRPPNARDLCPRGCGKAHGTGPCPLDDGAPVAARNGPATWAAPRGHPAPEVAKEGRARVDAAIAAARAAEGTREPPPTRPRTEDDYRALARRQVAEAQAVRARSDPAPKERTDDEAASGPLWEEPE